MSNIDDFDEELNSVFEDEEENTANLDENDEEIEQNATSEEKESDTEETLDDLLEDDRQKEQKSADKNSKKVDNSEQISKQQSNKSRRSNNSEDLVDNNGNIIAKAGAERRFYEENVKLKRERDNFNTNIMPNLKRNYDAMYNKCEAYEQTMQALRANDLTNEEIQTGLELIRNWKNSPEKTIEFLLTQAKSYGMNINTGTSVDTAAINQMLDDKLRPFIQERETAAEEARIKASSKKIYNDFMTSFPDARIHDKELGILWQKFPNLSLDAVYYMLKNHYTEKGFDFNTPLVENMKKFQQNQQRANSFGSVGVNQDIKSQDIKSSVASVNKSYDYIIKEAMRNNRK